MDSIAIVTIMGYFWKVLATNSIILLAQIFAKDGTF